jgi:hypothetical protein
MNPYTKRARKDLYKQAIEKYGNGYRLAAVLGYTRAAVYVWRGVVPLSSAEAVWDLLKK